MAASHPAAILAALQARGLRRVLVEGGAQTVSTFLSAGCLDRLHVVVAPMILGSGVTGLDLPPIARCGGLPMRVHPLGSDVLFDCDLRSGRRQQVAEARAAPSSAQDGSRGRRRARAGRQALAMIGVVDQLAQRLGERRDIARRHQPAGRAGTVSGIAPPVVPMTGRPCAIASAKAMP